MALDDVCGHAPACKGRGIFRPYMLPRNAISLFSALRTDRSAFIYSGHFHDEHTARLIGLGEAAIEVIGGKGGQRGRLAFIMVEAYQNILRHSTPLPPQLAHGAGRSMFVMRCGEHGQCVVAANAVKKEEVPRLREALSRLQGMGAAQLKALFLSGLQAEHQQPRRGAGLGLIEMARRSGSDLGYLVRDLEADHALFLLVVSMSAAQSNERILGEADILHAMVAEHDIILAHVGERPVGVQESLLRMVEDDLDQRHDRKALRGRAFLAGSGCLDHIAAPSAKRLLVISRDGEHESLVSGAVVEEQVAVALGERVARINVSDRSEVERRYRQALLQREGISGEADLFDLARMSVEALEFGSFPLEDGSGTLTLVRALI
jgi:Family of unknown function (DUF6272)